MISTLTEQNPAHEVEDAQPQYVRQSSRTRKAPVHLGLDEYADVTTIEHLACTAGQVLEPHTIEEALSGDDADKWQTATDSEYRSLLENETWDLVKLPHDRRAIPCGWVFRANYEEGENKTTSTSRELQRLHTLDDERQMLVEQLAEAERDLEEMKRREGKESRRLQALVADCERKTREQNDTIEELRADVSSRTNENSHLCRQLDVARNECTVVRAGLEEQLEVQTVAALHLRG